MPITQYPCPLPMPITHAHYPCLNINLDAPNQVLSIYTPFHQHIPLKLTQSLYSLYCFFWMMTIQAIHKSYQTIQNERNYSFRFTKHKLENIQACRA